MQSALAKFAPLLGALIGTLGGVVYWLAVQLWPASVAVILAMAATTALTAEAQGTAPMQIDLPVFVFYLLIKYSALMALTAAKLPYAVPANVPLGLVMVCGYAASFALMASVMAVRPAASRGKGRPGRAAQKVGNAGLAALLVMGFAPAALLGIPGLVGLASGIAASLALVVYRRFSAVRDGSVALFSEACFYLGALAAWSYV